MSMDEELQPELKAVIDAGIAARGWIINSYAQFENLLSDLVRRAHAFPEYADLRTPFRTSSRIATVRELLDRTGPLSQFKESIAGLLDRFEAFEDSRLMLVHAF